LAVVIVVVLPGGGSPDGEARVVDREIGIGRMSLHYFHDQ
jgi:hypothetical protein